MGVCSSRVLSRIALIQCSNQQSLTDCSARFCSGKVGTVSDSKHIWIPLMLEVVFVDIQPASLICQRTAFDHQIGSHWRCDMKHFILIRESKVLEIFTEASFPYLAYIRCKCNQSRHKIYIVFKDLNGKERTQHMVK